MATLLPEVFYGVRDLFQRIPVPPHVKPAIGGLGIGLIALFLPQVSGEDTDGFKRRSTATWLHHSYSRSFLPRSLHLP